MKDTASGRRVSLKFGVVGFAGVKLTPLPAALIEPRYFDPADRDGNSRDPGYALLRVVQEKSMDGTERIEPPTWYYAFAASILAIGFGAMIYSFVSGISRIRENLVHMDVPGQMDMELKHETYTVFLEYDTAAAARGPDAKVHCDVHVLPSGQVIDTRQNPVKHTYSYPGRTGVSFMEFDAPHDATYTLSCTTAGDTTGLKPTVAVGGGTAKGIRIMYLRSFVMMTVATVIALLIFMRVSMLRLQSRKEIRERGLRPV